MIMSLKSLGRTAVLFLLVLGQLDPALAGEPTEQIRQTTQRMIAVLNDPALQDLSKEEDRRKAIRKVANERFDWTEMAMRALARHWRDLSEKEKEEFVPLFTELLERTYMKRIENYSGDTVSYDGEKIDGSGSYSMVKVTIFTDKQVEIPVIYKMKKKEGEWRIYDVSIEGVSLVNNYRKQFDSVILSSSYQGLVEKLKEKVAKN
jgi:phospholipid transport system substrate-binding protein